ncbi:MAG: peptidoglycan DD-metalloendopeptidase family protein, partial [Solirubrobacterales bacterium]|nr:peptidoglycan DD-metalloendopeptidase family protein [Solirubrobacterales bacterium]
MSALAGSGLTAASLSGQLSSTALGAGAPGTTSTGEGAPPPPVSTTTVAGSQEATSGQPATTPTTTIAPPPLPSSKRPTTTSTGPKPSSPPPAAPEGPKVVLKQKQKSTGPSKANPNITATGKLKTGKPGASKSGPKSGPSSVALSPQVIASQAGALAAALASSAASVQALGFYRIPPFLLPIYKAAAAQYGVPWQILAAINEIETNYGSDQSVSTAGAVGWMQFMPATWLQYGVDALNAGYADPYNPVDAIFAAARYLRAAGAQTDLHAAILAYNHSEEYASSVLLRAKLISTYPRSVVATLTGLIDGRLPVTGKQVGWGALLPSRSSATANATAAGAPAGASKGEAATPVAESAKAAPAPGASPAPSPVSAAAEGRGKARPKAEAPLQLVDLMSAPNANVVAVQDGRIVQIGETRELGKYVVLRDVYGDVFTYAGLGSIAPTYTLPHAPSAAPQTPAATIANTHDHAPSRPATAGRQPPLTLRVKVPTPAHRSTAPDHAVVPADPAEATPAGMGKVRLFAHPGNPDAVASAASGARRASSNAGRRPPRLRRGAIVATGTVLGRVRTPSGAADGHLRFAIRPAGDGATVDPRPILASWAQLASALHPQGAKAARPLLGATATDVFLLSKDQLASDVLSDPGITVDACGRGDIASGAVDRRVLAMLAFLSRSGLQPTVSGLRCAPGAAAGSAAKPDRIVALDISAVNGTPISGHQGPGTVTDLTIRTLLSLPSEYQPERIVSLMRYPGAANTHATPQSWSHVQVQYHPASQAVALNPATAGAVARSAAAAARAAVAPLVV